MKDFERIEKLEKDLKFVVLRVDWVLSQCQRMIDHTEKVVEQNIRLIKLVEENERHQ